jgi:hypothetical protein
MKTDSSLWRAVDEILWEYWDPIGVNEEPVARDEYTSYVPSVVQLLKNGADARKISQHLLSLETVSMGISTASDHRKFVAEKLLDAFSKNAG